MENFQTAAGTITGRDHVQQLKNNQDGYSLFHTPNSIVGVVCDGCGSGDYSEVGARITARIVAYNAHTLTNSYQELGPEFLSMLESVTLASLRSTAQQLGDSPQMRGESLTYSQGKTVEDYLLCTVLGVVMTPKTVLVFFVGDGIVAVNGEIQVLEPNEGNSPDYLAYALTGSARGSDAWKLRTLCQIPTEELNSVLLATDGLEKIHWKPDTPMPVTGAPVGSLPQFWKNDAFFQNKDALRRKLFLMNRPNQRINWERKTIDSDPALLHDDTTVLVVRRKPQ